MNPLPQKIIVSGASGFVGKSLLTHLRSSGVNVVQLVRSEPKEPGVVLWNPEKQEIDASALSGADAVVHLAAENIADGRWSSSKKERIENSRVLGTTLLAQTLAKLEVRPKVLLSASAVGVYGNRGDESLTELSSLGTGFLAEVGTRWEQATKPASEAGIRVVHLRIGIVLGHGGGIVGRLQPIFSLGLGGPIGSGKQWMSWIALGDLIRAIEHCLCQTSISGPVNIVAPAPVTNQEFSKMLGRVLHRPAIFPVPGLALRLIFGQLAEDVLLASTKVYPKKLLESGFEFQHRDVLSALTEATSD